MTTDVTCTFDDPSHAGARAEDVCAMFAEQVAEAAPGKRLAITIKAPTSRQAEAIVRDADGTVIAENQFDVMDTQLGHSTWEDFAAATARAVAKQGI